MDSARDTSTGAIVFAPAFAQLSDAQRRGHTLECVGCKRTAHFRRGHAGRGPCFYVRPHDDCDYGTTRDDEHAGALEDEEFAVPTGRTVVLDLRSRAEIEGASVHITPDPTAAPHAGRGRGHVPGVGDAASRRRLRPMLRGLVETDLAKQTFTIRLGEEDRSASEFFVRDLQFGTARLDRVHGLWGRVKSVKEGERFTWLTTSSNVSLWVPVEVQEQLLVKLRLASLTDVAGHDFLTIAALTRREVQRDGETRQIRHVRITDPTAIVFRQSASGSTR